MLRVVPKSSEISFWREVLGVSVSKLINTIGVILLIIILNSEFTVPEIGVFFFFFVLVEFLSNFVAGVAKAVRKRVSGNSGKCPEYLVVGMLFAVVFQSIMSVLLLATFVFLPENLLPDTASMANLNLVLASIFLLFTQSLGKLMLNYNSGLGHPSRSEWVGRAVPGALFFISTIVVVYLGYGLSSIFVVGALGYLFSAVLMFFFTRPNLLTVPSREDFDSVMRFGKWSILSRIASNIYGSTDVLILGVLVTSVSVGYYQSSNDLVELSFIIPYGIFAVTSVKVSGLDAESRKNEIVSIVEESMKISPVLPVMLLFMSLGFGDIVIELVYGSSFTDAYYYFIGLLVVETLSSYRKPIVGLNEGTDNPRIPFYSNIVAIVVNFVSVLPLVFLFGGLGVVISTILSGIVRLASIFWMSRDYLKHVDEYVSFSYCYIIGTILLFFVLLAKRYIELDLFRELSLMSAFVFLYLTGLYLLFNVDLD
jgi:O-antigen/teichoic acid export membrane protein